MYKTNFLCTYQMLDLIKEEYKDENELKKDQELLYQIQLLEAFGITTLDFENNFDFINKSIEILYNKYKNDSQIKEILINHSYNKNTTPEIIFRILFSYDTFFLMHLCICDLENNNIIKQENFENMINYLNNMKL